MNQVELEAQIKDAQHAYYVLSAPVMSDAEFDSLWDDLQKDYPNSSLLSEVGDDRLEGWPKATHYLMLGSQNKITTESSFRGWCKSHDIKFPLCVQHKLDGLSLELIYKDGKLTQAITRGNGLIGDNVTRNALKIPSIPHQIIDPRSSIRAIRGEIVLSNELFDEKYSKEYSNPRNLASGLLKNLSGENCEDLTFVAYDMSVDEGEFSNYHDMDILLWRQFGFVTPITYIIKVEAAFMDCVRLNDINRDKCEFQIDGLVLKSCEIDQEDRLRPKPKKQVAWKFPPMVKTAKLLSVEWNLAGETLTPVAILTPTDLDGSVVQRASLVHLREIARIGAAIGDTISICKRGDIIPKVEKLEKLGEVREPIPVPTHCPECNTLLNQDESSRLYCPYALCQGKLIQRIEKWISKTGVLGMGQRMVQMLVSEKLVTCIADLYKEDLIPRALEKTLQKKNTERAIKALQEVRELPLEKFIGGLNMRSFGERQTKKLINAGFDSLQKIDLITREEFCQIEGFGPAVYESFRSQLTDLDYEIEQLVCAVKITAPLQKTRVDGVDGKVFVITGKLNTGARKEIQEKIELAGGKAGSSVNSKTSFLVNNDKESTSGKNKKAKDLGVTVITEEELLEMIGEK